MKFSNAIYEKSMIKKIFSSSFIYLFIVLAAVSFSSCESTKTIVNGLEEKDANEILVFLANKDIPATKIPSKVGQGAGGAVKIQLWDISVPADKATDAMAILNANGLPRRPTQSLLNLFSAGGLVPSEMQEKIRYQAGLADQIASTIRKIDGVLDADVSLSFPEEDPLNPTAAKGKVVASVYVKHNGALDDPNLHLMTKIKRLVASSVQGLSLDDVTVIGDKARLTDVNLQQSSNTAGLERYEYVKVWDIIIAKDSVSRFQFIFFWFCVIILLLCIILCWFGWKLYPILKKRGGLRMLFRLTPLPDEMEKKEEAPSEGTEPKDEKKPKGGGEPPAPKVQENVESQ